MRAAAIIAAAGQGARMGGPMRKQYLQLEGKPVLLRSAELFLNHAAVEEIIVVVPADDTESAAELLQPACPPGTVKIAAGGATRQESISSGLSALSLKSELVCVHDAARPLASEALLDRLLAAAERHGAAVPVITPGDTVKEVNGEGYIISTPDREHLRLVQTPQVFRRDIILSAYRNAAALGLEATDDSALVERMGRPVVTVPGEFSNLKITSPHDLMLAAFWLQEKKEAADK